MKIVYNPEKAAENIKKKAIKRAKCERLRNFTYFLNLITTLLLIYQPISCAITNQPFTLNSFLINILLIINVIVSTIMAKKSVSTPLSILSADELYHALTSKQCGVSLTAIKLKNTKDGYVVVFDTKNNETHENVPVCLGEFSRWVSNTVKEETVDLPARIVYVPEGTNPAPIEYKLIKEDVDNVCN